MRAPLQTTEVTRRLALSATEVAAMTALATALANDLPETENALQSGEIDIGVAAEIAALAGYLTPHEARLATDVMKPGTPEWRWLAPISDTTPAAPATPTAPLRQPRPAPVASTQSSGNPDRLDLPSSINCFHPGPNDFLHPVQSCRPLPAPVTTAHSS